MSLAHKVSMSHQTSWRVGGVADYLLTPAHAQEIVDVLRAPSTPQQVVWVGLGSNLLVRDGGYRGLVVCTHPGLSSMVKEEDQWYCMAGVPAPKFARHVVRHGYGGVEFMCGIPGTVGGALAMNAGAEGSAIWEYVTVVECMKSQPPYQTVRLTAKQFTYGYRSVTTGELKEPLWFLGAWFSFPRQPAAIGMQKIKTYLHKRNNSQPIGRASCGSVFKNPLPHHAGKLIDQAGCKGRAVGGAMISPKHANFIINTGDATAHDIETLMQEVQEIVFSQTNITLAPEAQIIGSPQ